jgi:hypothetical protein
MYALYYTGYGCTNFPRVWKTPQSSRSQKGNVKLFAHWGPTNVIRHGNLSPGICGRLIASFFIAGLLAAERTTATDDAALCTVLTMYQSRIKK